MKLGFLKVAALAAAVFVPGLSAAEDWPTRPVTVIVPATAGGSADTLARAVFQYVSEDLGQQFVIDNRGGAGGSIGASAAAKAPNDGYTFLFTPIGVAVINKLVYDDLDFDFDTAFTPVIQMTDTSVIIVSNPGFEAKTMDDLVALARAEPGQLNVGIPGIGSMPHIVLAEIMRRTGIEMNIIPYKGGGPLANDLVAGQIMVGVDGTAGYTGHIRDGSLHGIAVAFGNRVAALPDVPAVNESAAPELADFGASGWQAIWAPAGTSPEIVAKLNASINAYLASDAGKEFLASLSLDPVGGAPEVLGEAARSATELCRPVIESGAVKLD
ncbi:Bug family tripartite tricarboxylate transporter substrate binding protein [Neotabrizicola sp. VNH66]|uniref:Bug family tripartite tricarboxylate transporter substrate binding protein n=1 Tax=Neotabrizicola sp. VNH66 TaxID=3400918 RepID=UPI003C0632E9